LNGSPSQDGGYRMSDIPYTPVTLKAIPVSPVELVDYRIWYLMPDIYQMMIASFSDLIR